MHELRIVEDLLAIVEEVAREKKLQKVTRVNILMGQLVHVVPNIFETAFREAVRGSVAEDAVIDIEKTKVRLKCRDCGTEFMPSESCFECHNCGSGDTDIISGNELFIKSIEGE
jgi:hydrogenase nickel incorporation protein HypA/HybF